jgi:multisubunit Na+/H+ antiporter MnhE subunit
MRDRDESSESEFYKVRFWKFNAIMLFIWLWVTVGMLCNNVDRAQLLVGAIFGIVMHLAGSLYILKDDIIRFVKLLFGWRC